jgi:hypothetical protein
MTSMRFVYALDKHQPSKWSGYTALLLLIAAYSAFGIIFFMFNITFSGISFSLYSVVPLLVFAYAASAVVFVFKCINYQGSFIPAAALILLMELGLLLQVRLAIFPKNALYSETIPVGFNGILTSAVWYYVLLYIFF